MKNDKASRAMNYIDDDLILSAMKDSDLKDEVPCIILGRREKIMKAITRFNRSPLIAAILVVLIAVGIFGGIFVSGSGGATIALDVNPSIEIEINRKEKVKEINTFNVEADEVIEDMDLKGVDIDVAVNAIIGSMVTNGYLSVNQNSILISVNSKNETLANELKSRISADINAKLGDESIEASVLVQNFESSKEIEKMAEDNQISSAKATFINNIIKSGLTDANGVPYSFSTLAELNVNQLKLILESKAAVVEGVDYSGVASGGLYIGKDRAAEIALEDAGLSAADVSNVRVEMDFETEYFAMIYEVEFIFGENEYDYEIHAKEGTVLYKESEPINEVDDDDIPTQIPENIISREEALAIVYADAGISADKAKHIEIELDFEDGLYVYEIEFRAGLFLNEYDYTVNAVTGSIIEKGD